MDKFPGQQRIFVIKVDAEGSDAVILHEIIDWYEEAEQAIVEATTGKKGKIARAPTMRLCGWTRRGGLSAAWHGRCKSASRIG